MINHEEIFQAVKEQNWNFLIIVLYNNKKEILTDLLLTQAAHTFVTEFLKQVDSYPDDRNDITENLETLWTLNKGDFYKLSPDDLKSVTCHIVKRKKERNLREAYNYANLYPSETICKIVIETYDKEFPKNIEHSQSDIISVTETKEVANVDHTINLFKSEQEKQFFDALKNTFTSFHIYPNVAISCLLNWNLLKSDLTEEEKKYFFSGIIDVVVFDQVKGFKPIYFFELDSIFHDDPEIQRKDKMKDSIFARAGVKITRIRKNDPNVNEEEFIKLIRELIKN